MCHRVTALWFMAVSLVLATGSPAAAECNATLFSFSGPRDEIEIIDITPGSTPARMLFTLFTNDGLLRGHTAFDLVRRERVTMSARELYELVSFSCCTIANSYLAFTPLSPDDDRVFSLTITRGGHVYSPPCVTRARLGLGPGF